MPGAADDALRLSPATTSSSGSRSGSRNILRRRVIIIINSNALGAKGINILPDHPTPKGGTIGADRQRHGISARSPKSDIGRCLSRYLSPLLCGRIKKALGRSFFGYSTVRHRNPQLYSHEIIVGESICQYFFASCFHSVQPPLQHAAPNHENLLVIVLVIGVVTDAGAGGDEPRLAPEGGTDAGPFLCRPRHFLVLILRRNP
mmetsp:Transcript_17498/g.29128  ORF Transcript_17498/g.29128 Transcript_17498/m.29128 type:complete len:203 (+) Transcript_17498:207-815(+)